jgi:hypothetical protein
MVRRASARPSEKVACGLRYQAVERGKVATVKQSGPKIAMIAVRATDDCNSLQLRPDGYGGRLQNALLHRQIQGLVGAPIPEVFNRQIEDLTRQGQGSAIRRDKELETLRIEATTLTERTAHADELRAVVSSLQERQTGEGEGDSCSYNSKSYENILVYW